MGRAKSIQAGRSPTSNSADMISQNFEMKHKISICIMYLCRYPEYWLVATYQQLNLEAKVASKMYEVLKGRVES